MTFQEWSDRYLSPEMLCSLCGNCGVVDTRGVRSPAGVPCGRRNWCVCPNGEALRERAGGFGPDDRPRPPPL